MDCIRPVIEIVTCIGSVIGILSCLWPCCVTHANYLSKLQENGESLEESLNELKNERDDVQKKVDDAEANPNEPMKRTGRVNGWLQSVTAIEGEVREILQQVEQQTSRRCLGGCCPENCWSDYMVGKSVVINMTLVDELREKGRFEEVAYKLPPLPVQEEPRHPTVGMESMIEKAWRLIGDDEVRIMGLYGQGGVGKTSLLKQINNEFKKSTSSSTSTTHGFDVVIYVVVSNTLNIAAIQKEIGKRLGLESVDRRSIFNALTKKNFVLLLDDIWERVDLQSIGVPPVENSKSKVIFTTRSENMCGLMDANKSFKVECLPGDKAWTLFQEKVGNEALNSHPEVPKLAEAICKRCCGLPLALITIGRAMSSKKTIQGWRHAITTLQRSASEFPGMVDEVLHLLRLSYDSLHDETIKSCFLYLALFSEDYSMKISRLVDLLIWEGLILLDESDHIDDARNHGYDVIEILKGACLLESGRHEETHVKMHDSIRDLALWIAHGIKKDKMLIARAPEHLSEKLWCNAERVCCSWRIDSFEMKIAPPKFPNLRSLLFEDAYYDKIWSIPNNFFEFMPLLRVLDLSRTRIETFPTSITELLELRYLNLSDTNIKELPEELRNLVKLNYLDLSDMSYLRKIPSGVIGSLVQLRVLNLERTVVWDIEEGYNLKYLNDLQIFITTQQNLKKLLSNQNLPKCVRHLALHCIHGAELMNHYYYSIEQQQHLGSCFQNLCQIEIDDCNALKHLTWVGYVGNLKTLYVYCCKELEEIVKVADDFGGSTGGDEIAYAAWMNIFQRLETLYISGLPKLKSICRNALAFPCLVRIVVLQCAQLKKLPFDSASNINNSLQEIVGEQKWWGELQWEDNDKVKSKFLPYFSMFKPNG